MWTLHHMTPCGFLPPNANPNKGSINLSGSERLLRCSRRMAIQSQRQSTRNAIYRLRHPDAIRFGKSGGSFANNIR